MDSDMRQQVNIPRKEEMFRSNVYEGKTDRCLMVQLLYRNASFQVNECAERVLQEGRVFLSSLQPYYYYPDLSFSCSHKALVRMASSFVDGIFGFCFKPFLCAGPAERSGWKSLWLWHESWSLGLRFRSSGRASSSLVPDACAACTAHASAWVAGS